MDFSYLFTTTNPFPLLFLFFYYYYLETSDVFLHINNYIDSKPF